ncbi:MAG: cysteine methyltransferase, partial [Proteobacteria bacterium]|nr:cysteine methyltransferase [Pseudomonadota bacterium]
MTNDAEYAAVVAAPVGLLGLRMSAGQLVGIDFAPPVSSVDTAPDEATREVLDQLFQYFEDPAWQFDLSLGIQGTAFQRRVWQALTR